MNRTKRNTAKTLQDLKKLAIAKVEAAKDAVLERTGEARAKTTQAVTRFEKAFEQRVSKAAARLGVPSNKEVRALSRQVAELKASVEKLRRARA